MQLNSKNARGVNTFARHCIVSWLFKLNRTHARTFQNDKWMAERYMYKVANMKTYKLHHKYVGVPSRCIHVKKYDAEDTSASISSPLAGLAIDLENPGLVLHFELTLHNAILLPP